MKDDRTPEGGVKLRNAQNSLVAGNKFKDIDLILYAYQCGGCGNKGCTCASNLCKDHYWFFRYCYIYNNQLDNSIINYQQNFRNGNRLYEECSDKCVGDEACEVRRYYSDTRYIFVFYNDFINYNSGCPIYSNKKSICPIEDIGPYSSTNCEPHHYIYKKKLNNKYFNNNLCDIFKSKDGAEKTNSFTELEL